VRRMAMRVERSSFRTNSTALCASIRSLKVEVFEDERALTRVGLEEEEEDALTGMVAGTGVAGSDGGGVVNTVESVDWDGGCESGTTRSD
jgi:hypothetical protein